MYGVYVRINYKDLRGCLEKEWFLEWFKEEVDYGVEMYFKDFMKVV